MVYILYDIHKNAYFTNFGVTLMLQNGPMDKVFFFLKVVVSLQSRKKTTNKKKPQISC